MIPTPSPQPAMRLLVLLSLLLLPVGDAIAQTRRPAGTTPAPGSRQPTDAQLREQFRNNFLRGCLSGRTQGVRNQTAYCNCYANAYLARYDGRTLSLITQLAEQSGKNGPALVDLMMSPERRACTSRS